MSETAGAIGGHDGASGAEFVAHLNRGNDCLAAGDVQAAREELERAVALKPGDAKARGLLALCYFKLGMLERASAAYVALVHENPHDATLHVNLGLVQLKSGRPDAAIRTLEVALELAPDHRKAHNYLGVAFAQTGDHARARDSFLRAGSAAKAEEMERALAAAGAEASNSVVAPAHSAPALTRSNAPAAQPAVVAGTPSARPEALFPEPVRSAERIAEHELRSGPLPTFAEVVRSSRLFWPRGAPFALGPTGVSIDFTEGISTRVDGLIAARGDTSWTPLRKSYGGRLTDRPFGEGARQMWHATGGGQLLITGTLGGEERVFTALRLGEDVYVAEERLYAFEAGLDAENGRVPGKGFDLPLVRLRGSGHVLLVSDRPVRSEPVFGNESLRLPVSGLVAWAGPLTPRLLPMGDGPIWVELTGEGDVLVLG
ncbi:tetratricopeptide repeat protein [Vulgatibacter incomptus]|uniref:RING-type E3 ubiquitin transferase n=1 Tax=Vulgatibacter incomptus TaxID=1391653 RepID=A0A0K1PBL5_9BACT|nr:tetratricopeptide repeat protein [Vulgatibacter incomptus]AKU90887.1 TPR Domain containing protein [Vulgatibacter incomptus]